LWLPLALAAGAYLLTSSLMAVAIATGTLALFHIDAGSDFWVEAYAYPALVALSAVVVGWISWGRFRLHIEATHEERWESRRSGQIAPGAIQACLFDFDGTLAPNLDLPDMRRQIVAMAAAAGVPSRVYEGLHIVEVIHAAAQWLHDQAASADTGPAAAAAYTLASEQRIVDIEMAAAAVTELFPETRQMLSDLRGRGIKLGIVTRNCRAAVLSTFPDLEAYVDALHTRDDSQFLKPDPRHLQTNLAALDARPDRSLMIGDGALDMQAGMELGMHCVGVLSGSNDEDALDRAGANVVIPHVSDLLRYLDKAFD